MPLPPPHPPSLFSYCETTREQAGQLGNRDPCSRNLSIATYPLHSQSLNPCPDGNCATTTAKATPWCPGGEGRTRVTHHLKLKIAFNHRSFFYQAQEALSSLHFKCFAV